MIACPRCAAALVEGQEYCIECGARLPATGSFRRASDPGRGWMLRSALALTVAVAGTGAAIAVAGGGVETTELATATGGFATVPDAETLPAPPEGGPARVVEWPPGEEGWTIVLESFPQVKGRELAAEAARNARTTGLQPVGILDTSRYASFHPGYWVVFAGIYDSEADASGQLRRAKKVSKAATVRHVVP